MASLTNGYSRLFLPAAGAVLALCALSAAPARAAGEVALVRANSVILRDTVRVDSVGPADTALAQSTWFLILIKNIAFEKRVSLWIKNDTAWDSIPCGWVRQADDENEYWELYQDFSPGYGKPPRDLEFKIMYVEGKHTYWDDNGGRNYLLSRNGGTLLGGRQVLLKSARWSPDTGETADTSIFSGSAEVRGYREGSVLKISFTTDYLQTQDIRAVDGPPEPTWRGAAPADTDKVWLYRFSFAGIRLPFRKNPYLHFHLIWSDSARAWKDDNRGHEYAVGLNTRLESLVYEELPNPAALRYPARYRPARPGRGLSRMGETPVFDLGARGRVDGMGRSR
jgi:hypothetical protein